MKPNNANGKVSMMSI